MRPLRVALAGLGVRGSRWAEVLGRSPAVRTVAYCDPNPAAREAAMRRFGEAPGFATIVDAMEAMDGIDAVLLATPPAGRSGEIRAACDRGLPMLVEKPLSLDLDEARRMVEGAERAGVPLMVGLNFRYLGVTEALRRILRDEVVGRPEFAHFTYERYRDGTRSDLNSYPLTMDQPMLWEQSIHHFDLMRFVYGRRAVSVYARTWNPSWSMYEGDANVAAVFTFEGDFPVTYQGTWQGNWAPLHFAWRTECTDGVVLQSEQFGALAYAHRADDHPTPVPLPEHEDRISDAAGLLDAFVAAIDGRSPLACTGRDHLESLAMVQACVVSQREGRVVLLDEVLPA